MNKRFRSLRKVFAFALLGSFLTPAALAQQQTETSAPDPTKGWIKICEEEENLKREVCVLTIQIVGNNGRPVASVRLAEVEGAESKGFTIVVPPGLLLQPGLRVQVDAAKQSAVPYQICLPNACLAEARVDDAFVTSLKRGNNLKIVALNRAGKPVEFTATLAGFTATYDGPGLDPEVAKAATETLQQKLQRRAEEARQKLLDEKQEGTGEAQAN